MPLYNQQTNLAEQGKFAPGVSYYAGIRAPVPAAPRIEKGQYSFNIDTAPLANAYISSKELEAKKYEAEADRAFRQGLAEMEDKRYRDLEALRDAREREFHADDVDYRNKSLEIEQYKALSNYDIELRKLLADKEKAASASSIENDKKLASTILNRFAIYARKASLKMQQDPTYTIQRASEDVYNYGTTLQSEYADILDQSKMADIINRYGFGFGGIQKANENIQKNVFEANEKTFQTVKSKTNLQYRPDTVARIIYDETDNQLNTFMHYKDVMSSPYTTEDQRKAAFNQMRNSGVNLAKYSILNNMYEFANQSIDKANYSNVVQYLAGLRNKSVKGLSSSMSLQEANDYYDIAEIKLGVRAFADSYIEYHKKSAEVADNIASDMLNNTNLENLGRIDWYRNMKAIGVRPVDMDPATAADLGKQITAVINSNPVTFDEESKTYSYKGKQYSAQEVGSFMEIYDVKDPFTAVTIAATTAARNMPSLREEGLATGEDVNNASYAELAHLTAPGQIRTPRDLETVRNNLESIDLEDQYQQCKRHTDTKEAAINCINMSQFFYLLGDKVLEKNIFNVAHATSVLGSEHSVGFKYNGNNVELGYIDDNVDATDENLNNLAELQKRLNSVYPNIGVEAKLMYIRSFNGLSQTRYVGNNYEGTFKQSPNLLQKILGNITRADMTISQAHDSKENK